MEETEMDFEKKDYKIFEKFNKDWAVVSAGSLERFNGCTISWGSMGTLWSRPGGDSSIIIVYLHPARYTTEFMKENVFFTVSFFPESFRKAISVMGSMSGRNCNKPKEAGLTPLEIFSEKGSSMGYKDASGTFLCRKIYQGPFAKEGLAPEIAEYYKSRPQAFPPGEDGEWQPHWIFIGEVMEYKEAK